MCFQVTLCTSIIICLIESDDWVNILALRSKFHNFEEIFFTSLLSFSSIFTHLKDGFVFIF